jgi:transposase-like protein
MSTMNPEAFATSEPAVNGTTPPDPEGLERPRRRRRFSAEYRLRILRQADACTMPGELGALLRREGLYSSSLANWRRQRDRGVTEALSQPRGRQPTDPAVLLNAKLVKENARLTKELAAAQMVIRIQGNVSELLGIALESAETPR